MAYRFIKNVWAALTQLANVDVWHIADSGAPTSGTSGTGVGFAGPGSIYTNIANGATYVNTNTKASPTWSVLANNAANPYGIVAAGTGSSGTTTGASLSVTGVLTTDVVQVTWKTAPQTIAEVVASATTGAITISFVDGTAAQTVGTAGVLQYAVIRAN